ncbi:hypothetical protein [Altibacter sp.]|uniref:DUF7033 domain-containing protein n=1 Tax=Altibacter sp. TaxID=2024823 RepID=UPI000C97D870|nr:hypothetical protein [Altibacter sp.]MAP55166.1 hypothetical protein [Altibacter sp.]
MSTVLVYTQKVTPRITYIFKHICTRILGLEVNFTSQIEDFIAYDGPKLSYGKQPMGNELFIQSHGLLTQQGIDSEDIAVKDWEATKCFFAMGEKSDLPFDIFSAGFYLLSRFEEYLPHVKDEMGRFPANESLAFNNGFLSQPVVDIWAYKFKAVLLQHFPSLVFLPKSMTVHNLVKARQPYAYNQRGAFRSLVGYGKDLLQFKMSRILERSRVIMGLRQDPFDTFEWLISEARRSTNKLTVFFLLGEATVFEESINTYRQKFKMLLKYVSDYKEVGLIFSFDALQDYEMLRIEKKRIESITNRSLQSSMNAQYLVHLPELYRNLVELEVQKDFTMGYENEPGFRAGTCTPFLFYDLDYEIKTPLIIHPITASTRSFKNKYASDITKKIDQLWTSVAEVHGTFSIVFTNRDFTPTIGNTIWRELFSKKLNPDA